MPNFDRTGPRGAGPMTGRALGLCGRRGGAAAGGGAGFGQGGGRRRRGGGGGGRGWGARFGAEAAPGAAAPAEIAEFASEPTAEERRRVLKAERNRLKSRLDEVEETLRGIPRKPAGEPES